MCHKIFLEILPSAHYVILITDFILLVKTPPFYVDIFNPECGQK